MLVSNSGEKETSCRALLHVFPSSATLSRPAHAAKELCKHMTLFKIAIKGFYDFRNSDSIQGFTAEGSPNLSSDSDLFWT